MTSTRFFRSWAPVLAASLFLVLAPAASGSSGTLVVTNSTTLTQDHHGNILIVNSNVTLDCAGHVVVGPGEPGFNGGIEIAAGLNGVTVKRCGVTAFNVNGIFGGGGATDCRYEANVLYANGNHGMHLDFGSGYVVLDNTSRSNGAIGIVLTGATQSWIVHNTVQANRNWAGIALFENSHDNHIVNNTSLSNGIGFVLVDSTNNQLQLNTSSFNSTQGMALIRSGNNQVDSNAINQNLIGLEITESSNANTVRSNTSNLNKTDGIKVFMSDGNNFTSNTANQNGEVGFWVFGGSSFNTLTRNVGRQNVSLDALDDGTGSGNVWANNSFGTTSGF